MSRIVVFVQGGAVVAVESDVPGAEAVVVDMDAEGLDDARRRVVTTADGDRTVGAMERVEVDLSPETGKFFAAADRGDFDPVDRLEEVECE